MYCDPNGHFPLLTIALSRLETITATQVTTSAVSYIGMSVAAVASKLFGEGKLWDDMCAIKWNPFNSNEYTVLKANSISFYKGMPVFHISGRGGSMSLGALWFDRSQGIDVLRHERGHSTQLMVMGLGNYLIQIGIPSIWKNGDETPWELSASILGGDTSISGFTDKQISDANRYFALASIPIVNIYTIFWYIFY